MKKILIIFSLYFSVTSFGAEFSNRPSEWGPLGKVIYHGGEYDILKRDVDAHTVPKNDWDQFIRGPHSRCNLAPYRRGLYGFENIPLARPYAQISQRPGIIAITIEDICLEEKHVARSGSDNLFFNVHTNLPFFSWLKDNAETEVIEFCTESNGDWRQGLQSRSYIAKCQTLADQYLVQNEKWIVQDDSVNNAWYIRERECIQDIHWVSDPM